MAAFRRLKITSFVETLNGSKQTFVGLVIATPIAGVRFFSRYPNLALLALGLFIVSHWARDKFTLSNRRRDEFKSVAVYRNGFDYHTRGEKKVFRYMFTLGRTFSITYRLLAYRCVALRTLFLHCYCNTTLVYLFYVFT